MIGSSKSIYCILYQNHDVPHPTNQKIPRQKMDVIDIDDDILTTPKTEEFPQVIQTTSQPTATIAKTVTSFDESQLKAIHADIANPLIITAGPGSGKVIIDNLIPRHELFWKEFPISMNSIQELESLR
jgi:hypothetical protein